MTSHNSHRVLVHLKTLGTSKPLLGKFSDCVVKRLSVPERIQKECQEENGCCNIPVDYELVDNKFILSPSKRKSEEAPTLCHPSFCPVLELNDEIYSPETLNRGINLGVVALLESADQHILITRRAAHMRTFPMVWVPPGGGIDLGESLIQCGIRELHEETGLKLAMESICWHVLCMWESVYPPMVNKGKPTRHHIVVYLHLLSDKSHTELQNYIKLQKEETDACAWLSPKLATLASGQWSDERVSSSKGTFSGTKIYGDGEHRPHEFPLRTLYARCENEVGSIVERVSTGTRFAISEWLKKCFKKCPKGKKIL